jgi:RNA recognition motif-containing protein
MKLHVGNLPFSVSDEDLKNLFASYNAEEVTLIKDKFSGRSKGFGFVTISNDEVAQKAISELNGKDVQGRELKVSEARPMEERPERPRRSFGDRDGGRSFGGGNRGGSSGGFNSRRRF